MPFELHEIFRFNMPLLQAPQPKHFFAFSLLERHWAANGCCCHRSCTKQNKIFLDTPTLTRVCRDLVKEGFPLHDEHIHALLASIGDHEEDVIETVMAAVANAR